MVRVAWENNIIDGEPYKAFRSVKKLLARNGNARNRDLSCDEYKRLSGALQGHTRLVVDFAFWTEV